MFRIDCRRVLKPKTSGVKDYGIYYLAPAEDIVKQLLLLPPLLQLTACVYYYYMICKTVAIIQTPCHLPFVPPLPLSRERVFGEIVVSAQTTLLAPYKYARHRYSVLYTGIKCMYKLLVKSFGFFYFVFTQTNSSRNCARLNYYYPRHSVLLFFYFFVTHSRQRYITRVRSNENSLPSLAHGLCRSTRADFTYDEHL